MPNDNPSKDKDIDIHSLKFAASQFMLGNIIDVTKLDAKGDRLVFKVVTDKGSFIIKSADSKSSHDKVRQDIYGLKYLADHHMPVPHLQQTQEGNHTIYINRRVTYAYEYLEGDHPKPSPTYFDQLGELIGRLHNVPAETYPYASQFVPQLVLPHVRKDVEKMADLDHLESKTILHAIDTFPSFGHLPRSIIHTDLYFQNLIQNQNGLYLIDLDDAGVAPAIIDVGYVLAHCCTTEPGDREDWNMAGEGVIWHQDWAEHFLDSYQKVRPLTKQEKHFLPDAASFGMLAYITDWIKPDTLSDTRLERYNLICRNVPLLLK
jgi:Ser/Thr protein kinase RdoA (MazF antagonist)